MMDFGAGGENPFRTQYLLAGGDKIGMILLRLTVDENSFDRGTAAIDRLREILAEASLAYPDVRIGLTGLPVMENDEMRSSTDATIKGSVVSLLGVLAIFIVGFGGLRHPMMAGAALVIGICWTLAYIVFTIGHLNILSMSFGLILIGLGIDFGVHYVARYFQERQSTSSSAKALVATADAIGPGVITGGVTTALAFFTAGLTDFTGVAELGVIAGGGVLLCLLAAMLVLPAMIELSDRGRDIKMEARLLAVHRWFGFTRRLPRLTLLASVLVTGVCCLGLPDVWYDHNLLNLQPVGLESVKLERRLLEETEQSVWYAISLADSREELLARKARFEALDSVERTEEIASLLPGDEKLKSAILRQMREQLAGLPETAPQLPVDDPAETARALVAAHRQLGLWTDGPGEKWMQVVETLRKRPADAYRALGAYQQRMVNDLLARLKALRARANPVGPRLEDLPPSLVERFVGDSGRYLIKVYSKADIWDMDALRKFVHDVRSVDSRATGQPLQTYEASRQMQRSYVHAALYALIAVLMVLMIDFRSVSYSLCALLPVGLGMTLMFGLMGLLDIPLNPANAIVLPLILGIGVDNGVHVLHDFRRQPGQYRLSRATATAVVITSLTTMAGFGSMMIADHRGLESLGRVLTLGVGCCLFMALVPLPALLAWISRHEPEPEDASPESEEESEAELAEAARAGA
jgi:hopanoid biosynthesis associated RND transporter like protein HpnN